MRLFGRGEKKSGTGRTVAEAAIAGASREELIQAAMQQLRDQVRADRLGVWLVEASGPGDFLGIVWDSQQELTPASWTRLSPEISYFLKPLTAVERSAQSSFRATAERSTLDISPDTPILGPLVEMRRALWVPVERHGHWQGLLLAASRSRNAVFPREEMEGIAAELSLALSIADERRMASNRLTDLTLVGKLLHPIEETPAVEELLRNIAADCCVTVGASFAVVGCPSKEQGSKLDPAGAGGDPDVRTQLESEPLAGLWRQALESGRITGADGSGPLADAGVVRFVAIPLRWDREVRGVLLAGLDQDHAALSTLERLELRALLAGRALAQRSRQRQEAQRAARAHTFVRQRTEPRLILDSRGEVVGKSPGAQILLGPVQASPIRPQFAALFRPEDRDLMASWWERASTAREPNVGPAEAEFANGIRIRFHTPVPVADDLYAVLFEEVPTQGESRQTVAAAETELRNLLEWLEQGVVLFDSQQRVRAMNTRFAQIAGLDPGETARIGTLDALIVRLAENAAEPAALAERWRELAQLGEGGVREEIHLVRPAARILERAARPVMDSEGRRIGWLEIYRDLTAQRVFQSKLLQTEKLAALGQMVTGVAHELSNPLTSILGYAQRLLLRDEAGAGEELRQIYQEAERASRILRDLLQTGRDARPVRRTVLMNQLIVRAIELRRFALSADKIRIEMDLDPGLPPVLGDADQLQQVAMNLVANAQQAIEQDAGRGTIRVQTRRLNQNRLQLEVSDTGPGIPPTILARIFDPFFTTKPAGLGTGLGLSIVLGVVREHGGQIRAANRPGGGAVFTVELPAAVEEQPALVPAEARRAKAARVPRERRAAPGATSSRTAARVLVVEDEPTVARLIGDVLEDLGLQADILLDGREALKRAGQRNYDLVICDLKMPGLDGQHFYDGLVRMNSPLREHAVFVSGDTVSASTLEFLERNHLACVAKPFHVDELTEAIRSALRLRTPVKSQSAAVRNK